MNAFEAVSFFQTDTYTILFRNPFYCIKDCWAHSRKRGSVPMYSSVTSFLIHMNASRLFPCQAGLNGPAGLMRKDNLEKGVFGGKTKKKDYEGAQNENK